MNDAGTAVLVLWMAFGYLVGSFPTGYVLVKLKTGEDIRRSGSGNIGATNVARVLGKKWSVFTAVCDVSKGGAAMLAAMLFGLNDPVLLSAVGFTAVLGHDFPVWLGWRGGKGVATTFGVFACYDFFNPLPAIFGGVVWFAVRELSLHASLASLVALIAASLSMPFFMGNKIYLVSGLALSALSILRHSDNIKRLLSGEESTVKPIFRKDAWGKRSGRQ
ncbi:MAG: glycerol-3-phosphate 1-O-acyltransferase PlsY [Synergistaceae bacterium]|jgi:glycerol-3-phosphate acyltransferase PlsY|nr:glycerol-3-phosphate 1-O-acyltransferase PlsY [Synergistaceae bacterium]